MSDELPGGGTSQISGASQTAAATSAEAAPQSAATKLYQPAANPATQQQASEGKESVPSEASHAESDGPKGPKADAESPGAKAPNGEAEEGTGDHSEAEERDADSATQGAPEKYEFKPVEGVNLSKEVVGKFSEMAKELNLTQDAAQKMLDQVAPAIARQQYAAIQNLNEQWVNAVKADKEIGGEKLGANLAIAKKARDAFGTDGLRTLLNESRIGNHPEVIRFFVRAGQAISEDTFVSGGTRPASGGKDAATVLYGKQH